MARDHYACMNDVFSVPLPFEGVSYPIANFCDGEPAFYVYVTSAFVVIGLLIAGYQFAKSLNFYRESWWLAFLKFFFLSLGFLAFSIAGMATCNSYGCQLASPLGVASNWYFPLFVAFFGLFILSGVSKLVAIVWHMTRYAD